MYNEKLRLELPKIKVPTMTTTFEIELEVKGVTDYGKWLLNDYRPIAGGAEAGASLSQDACQKILNHIFNDGTYSVPTAYLGLWTSALTGTSTSATAGELTYT